MTLTPRPFSRGPALCLAFTLTTMLAGFVAPAHAQTSATTKPSDGPQPVIAEPAESSSEKKPIGAPSVVLELNDAGFTYKQELDRVQGTFRNVMVPTDKLRTLQNAEKAFRDNPQDQQAAANYADAFSEALEAFEGALKKCVESREPLEKSHQRFVASTKSAIEAVKKEREQHTQKESESARSAQEMEQQLEELTVELKPQIEKGLSLPPDIDMQVVRLANLLEQQQRSKQLHAARTKRAASNLVKLEKSLSGGQHQMERMRLLFEKADGDLSLIGEIAQAKAEELTPDPVEFSDDGVDEFFAIDLTPFFKPSSDDSEPKPAEANAITATRSLGGADVLRARLANRAKATGAKPTEAATALGKKN